MKAPEICRLLGEMEASQEELKTDELPGCIFLNGNMNGDSSSPNTAVPVPKWSKKDTFFKNDKVVNTNVSSQITLLALMITLRKRGFNTVTLYLR